MSSNVIPPIQLYRGANTPFKTALQNQVKNTKAHNALNNKYGGSITVPQAPDLMTAAGPNTANVLSKGMSTTLVNSHAQAIYDNLAGKPAPKTTSGGTLLNRLERLVYKKKGRKTKRGTRESRKGRKNKRRPTRKKK